MGYRYTHIQYNQVIKYRLIKKKNPKIDIIIL